MNMNSPSAYIQYAHKDKNTTQENLAEPVGSPAVEADVKEASRNPKRIQREARKQVLCSGIGTKSQQALKPQRQQIKMERKASGKEQREAEKQRQFELKQKKRKEKHRGRICMCNDLVTKLCYGNTNTYFIRGRNGGLLIDTDYAGTLPAFYKEIKKSDITVADITYVLATHYHPDHIGLISELMKLGVKLLLIDLQCESVHFSDKIFKRDQHLAYEPIIETDAVIISCEESRTFLSALGIDGEIISTASHSADSIAVVLDDGCCFVGDLEPMNHVDAYENHTALRADWERVMHYKPKIIYYGHAKESILS